MVTILCDGAIIVFHAVPVAVSGLFSVAQLGSVALDIVTAGHVIHVGIIARVASISDSDECDALILVVIFRSVLVIIVDDIDLSATRTAVAGALRIVHEAVAEIHILRLKAVAPFVFVVVVVGCISVPFVSCSVEAWTTVGQMCQEIMMETGKLATPDASIAVRTLIMTRVCQGFCHGTPLHSEVIVIIERSHLVDAP